jgi:hypothetical protein
MTAYARHYVGHFEDDQQYPGGFLSMALAIV